MFVCNWFSVIDMALHIAVWHSGCALQAEALRSDPAGFARQQQVLDNARQLVNRAKIQVAELEGNMPSLDTVCT